jgi:taurine dioxygenase
MLDITPINGTFGATVRGLSLEARVDDVDVAALGKALADHKVLVMPEVELAGADDLLALAERFGAAETVEHPTHDHYPGLPGVKVLHSDGTTRADTWHTDGSTRVDTEWLTFLQAVDVPPYGRDTMFADMEAVFARLSRPMQEFLVGLTARHSWGSQRPDAPPVEHPVVMTDPRSGRKWLYVNRVYTREILGLTPDESANLLQFLFERVHQPECQLRVSWSPGTLAVWDNQITQHYLVYDYTYPRVMHRVMVVPHRS